MPQRAHPVIIHSPVRPVVSPTDTILDNVLVLHHMQLSTRMVEILTLVSVVSLGTAGRKKLY
jgi:hypothetical protein